LNDQNAAVDISDRARRHAALGDPVRLAMVDDLAMSDRSPGELSTRHGLATNLLAHHLDVLENAGLIERGVSSGDGRRRYVRLRRRSLRELDIHLEIPVGPVLFVCTHNSARSQLAAALWKSEVGTDALSAGTHPAERVHPEAIAAAGREGLDISDAVPRSLDEVTVVPGLVVTVCDRAHEELDPGDDWWHWSTPDPLETAETRAFDLAMAGLRDRITTLKGGLET
jgi:protein-tyrosine-phosphatase